MYKLFIDTAKRGDRKVRLYSTDGEKEEVVGEFSGDIDVVKSIEKLLKDAKLKPEDVELYEPNLGPGSFTGLKTGVTIANVLNWAVGNVEIDKLFYPEYGAEPNISRPKTE